MPAKAGQIVIDITAGTAKFVADMETATGKIREFGSAGVSETKATRAAFKVLEGDMLNNTRAAEQFAEKYLGIGKLAGVIFPVIGASALIGTLVEGGSKIKEFFDGVLQLPGKISGAFRELSNPLQTTNDELQVSNDRLANDIAKLDGRHANNLKLMLDQAVESADKLADSLDKTLSQLNKIVKDNNTKWYQEWFGNKADTDDLKSEFGGDVGNEGFIGKINKITDDGTDAIRKSTDAKAKDAAQTKLNTELNRAYTAEIYDMGQVLKEAQENQGAHDRNSLHNRDQSARIAEVQGIIRQLRLEQSGVGLQNTNTNLTSRKDELSGGSDQRKKIAETLLRINNDIAATRAAQLGTLERIDAAEENEVHNLAAAHTQTQATLEANAQLYDLKRQSAAGQMYMDYFKSILAATQQWKLFGIEAKGALSKATGAEVEEGIKRLEEGSKAAQKWAEAYTKITQQSDSESLRHRVSMAGIAGNPSDPLGTLANQQAIEKLDIETRYEEKLKNATSDLDRSIAIREKELELQKLQFEIEERTAAARHKRLRDFIVDMQGQSKNLGDILYDGAHSGLDRLSDQFSKLITGQKTSFGAMFKSIGEDLTKESVHSGLQKGLGALGKHFGIHAPTGKPDGSQGNPFWVIPIGNGAPANPLAGMVPSLPPALGKSASSGGLGGIFNGIGGFIGGLFGKGSGGGSQGMSTSSITFMAGGGDAEPGKVYGVGEAGEAELVSPKNSSRITPLSKLSGGDVHYHYGPIDARGADLGARNRVARAIEASHSAAVQDSVRANAEHSRRVPRKKR